MDERIELFINQVNEMNLENFVNGSYANSKLLFAQTLILKEIAESLKEIQLCIQEKADREFTQALYMKE